MSYILVGCASFLKVDPVRIVSVCVCVCVCVHPEAINLITSGVMRHDMDPIQLG